MLLKYNIMMWIVLWGNWQYFLRLCFFLLASLALFTPSLPLCLEAFPSWRHDCVPLAGWLCRLRRAMEALRTERCSATLWEDDVMARASLSYSYSLSLPLSLCLFFSAGPNIPLQCRVGHLTCVDIRAQQLVLDQCSRCIGWTWSERREEDSKEKIHFFS